MYNETRDGIYLYRNYENIDRLKDKHKAKAENKYMEILKTLKHINSALFENYVKWLVLLTEHRANLLNQKIERIIDKANDYTVTELEKTFRLYLEEIDKTYSNFEFTEYYFNPDYVNEYAKMCAEIKEKDVKGMINHDQLKETGKLLNEFKNIKFYTWDEYAFFLSKFEISFAFIHPEFKKRFILERKIKLDSIVKMDTYLLDIYSENQYYDQYQFVRKALFDINNLKSEAKANRSQFDQVAALSKVIGFPIDTKKTSLAEYESYEEIGRDVIEHQKEKTNKPNPA